MTGQADVVILGGGFMGAATAFFLRQRGRSVILLDADRIGRQASGTNFGNVRRQGRPHNQLPLANRSRAIWGRLPALVGEDCEFVARGHLRVCFNEAMAAEMEDYARLAREHELDLTLLSGAATRERFAFLGQKVVAGSLAPVDGHANPRLAAPAFGRAAARAGAAVHENAKAVAVQKTGEDFEVTVEDGRRFRAPVLLVTAGAWAAPFAAGFGEAVPYQVKGPQMSVTEPAPYCIAPSVGVATKIPDEVVYFRQVTRGNIVIGGPRHGPASAETRRANVLAENTLFQLAVTREVLPLLDRLRIIRVWSGVECYLPDSQPVMGPSERVPGLFYAFGFSGSGFQLGPGVGDVMAELIDTGRTSTPIEAFSIKRFSNVAASPG